MKPPLKRFFRMPPLWYVVHCRLLRGGQGPHSWEYFFPFPAVYLFSLPFHAFDVFSLWLMRWSWKSDEREKKFLFFLNGLPTPLLSLFSFFFEDEQEYLVRFFEITFEEELRGVAAA
jgi:hypothetical protein